MSSLEERIANIVAAMPKGELARLAAAAERELELTDDISREQRGAFTVVIARLRAAADDNAGRVARMSALLSQHIRTIEGGRSQLMFCSLLDRAVEQLLRSCELEYSA